MINNYKKLIFGITFLVIVLSVFVVGINIVKAVNCGGTEGLCVATCADPFVEGTNNTLCSNDNQKCCVCKSGTVPDGSGSCNPVCETTNCKPSTCGDDMDPDTTRSCVDTAKVCCKPKPVPKACTDIGGTCVASSDKCDTNTGKYDEINATDCNKDSTSANKGCCIAFPTCESLKGTCLAKCTAPAKSVDASGCDVVPSNDKCCVDPDAAKDETKPGADSSNIGGAMGTDSTSKAFNAGLALLTVGIGLVIHFLNWLASKLLIVEVEILIFISGYNNFIRNSYVSQGWQVMRDLVNMFFVLGLLFIAFVTVLKIEKYQWNKLLGRLLLMAILVNFSKTICGLIIDFFQVLMMTFVKAYKDITAGNIFSSLGVTEWASLSHKAVSGNLAAGVQVGILASSLLGLIMAVISMIIILVFIIILVVRIIALWILVIFSPLAFFAYTFSGMGGKVGSITSSWWSEFLNYCMIGPLLAFFLWLSVATMGKFDVNALVSADYYDPAQRAGVQTTFTSAGTMDKLIVYVMSIAMLVVGISYAQKLGVVGSGGLQQLSAGLKDATAGRASRLASWGANAPGRATGWGAGKLWKQAKRPGSLALEFAKTGVSKYREGVADKWARNKSPLQYITKAGQKRALDSFGAATKEKAGGGAVGKAETRAKNAEESVAYSQNIDRSNIAEVKDELEKYEKGEVNYNASVIQNLYTTLADAGELDRDQKILADKHLETDKWSDTERKIYWEDMDKRQAEEGVYASLSDVVHNADTNLNEDVGSTGVLVDQESKGMKELKNLYAKEKGVAQWAVLDDDDKEVFEKEMLNVDLEDLTKFDKASNTYEIDVDSKEYDRLQNSNNDLLKGITKASTQSQTDVGGIDAQHRIKSKENGFYGVVRSDYVKKKKAQEVYLGYSSGDTKKLNSGLKNRQYADFADAEPERAVEAITAVTERTEKLAKCEETARNHVNAKARFEQADGKERAKIVKNNKQHFNKALHQQKDEDDDQYLDRMDGKEVKSKLTPAESDKDFAKRQRTAENIKYINRRNENMSVEDLEKRQNLIVMSSAKYDPRGKVEKEGIKSGAVEARISKLKVAKGETVKIDTDKEVMNLNSANELNVSGFKVQDAKDYMNDRFVHELPKFTTENDEQKREIIVKRLTGSGYFTNKGSGSMADHVMTDIKQWETRSNNLREAKTDTQKDIFEIVANVRSEYESGDNDTGRIDRQINVLIDEVDERTNSKGLGTDDMKANEVKETLKKMKSLLSTAKLTPSAMTKGKFVGEMKKHEAKLKKLGYSKQKSDSNK